MEHNISDRFSTLIKLADYWKANMSPKPSRGDSVAERTWEGLNSLLEEFSRFVLEYQALLGKTPPIANPGFILNRGTERLLESFSIISRACEQRNGPLAQGNMLHYLARAEDVMESYCNRWRPDITRQGAYTVLQTPVVYFEKVYDITRAIYKPEVPVVAIPLTDYDCPERWQALAHEFGHHIYWNALVQPQDVRDLHTGILKDVRALTGDEAGIWEYWIEEVFADICGTLLSGLDYVRSCQDLAVENVGKPDRLIFDDQEHPILYLRPFIASQVFTELGIGTEKPDQANAQEHLAQRWEVFTAQIHSRLEKKPALPLGKLKNQVKPVVSAILNNKGWPGNKSLLELINFDTLSSLPPIEVKPFIFLSSDKDIEGPPDAVIPDALRDTWQFLKRQLDDVNLPNNDKPLKQWTTLLELNLEEEHGHIISHQRIMAHPPFIGNHRHSRAGQIIWE
jgi:hypothetical protein